MLAINHGGNILHDHLASRTVNKLLLIRPYFIDIIICKEKLKRKIHEHVFASESVEDNHLLEFLECFGLNYCNAIIFIVWGNLKQLFYPPG
jgi:hypothetical protein